MFLPLIFAAESALALLNTCNVRETSASWSLTPTKEKLDGFFYLSKILISVITACKEMCTGQEKLMGVDAIMYDIMNPSRDGGCAIYDY